MSTFRGPVLIVPGVLFWDSLYEGMRLALAGRMPLERIEIAPVGFGDWVGFPPSPERSTNRVMKVIDRSLERLEERFPGEQVTIVAHSGGGTVAMVYLLEKPFQGEVYHRARQVSRLVTLGTPFHTHEQYAKLKTDFIERHLTPEFFRRIPVVSVVSDKYRGSMQGGFTEKMCHMFYRSTWGDGDASGDGIVPAESCRLQGARNVLIPDAEHLPTPHTRWYGTPEGVAQWAGWLDDDGSVA
ncbi:alpha/beta fold hydrolase [Chlorobium sp. N1]|uniref:esterase/lipase family protein n=1 Tax=Chlorobium sp. N1 TaxID=2491138 RepID=UPI00103A60A0|nr:alpha/beta fold hydrolase [Chlorobium sp. N1]TCD48372.1 alpha/beta hydrolase [Chlorobium sp. N1]